MVYRYPDELSGGQKQRVAIARALSNKPSVIFADEPTGNLDSETSNNIIELLNDVVRRFDMTLVMVTHDLNIANNCDRILEIMDGKLVRCEKRVCE